MRLCSSSRSQISPTLPRERGWAGQNKGVKGRDRQGQRGRKETGWWWGGGGVGGAGREKRENERSNERNFH